MSMKRRDFLKVVGLSAAMTLGGKAAFGLFAPGEAAASIEKLPLVKGNKYGMVVDTAKMTGKVLDACQSACHRIHNVPDWGNPRIEIKWAWKDTFGHSFPGQEHDYFDEEFEEKNFLLLCNHCDNPACVRVCPTKATWKREEDGVVMMDPHRCIGCRFCMAACPFGARSFNWGDPRKAPQKLNPHFPTNPDYPTRMKGVVEKCNFCAERLARGEFPACVEAANELAGGALTFGDLADPHSDVRELLRENYVIRRKPELGTAPNIYYIV